MSFRTYRAPDTNSFVKEETLLEYLHDGICDRHHLDGDKVPAHFPNNYYIYEGDEFKKLPKFHITCQNPDETIMDNRWYEIKFVYPKRVMERSFPNSLIVPGSKARMFNHFFTFLFCGDTDVTFEEIMGKKMNDGFDNYTPDYCYKAPGCHYIVEFGTCAISNQQYLVNYADSKILKYQNPLSTRSMLEDVRIQYDVIIASPKIVLSTFEMENKLASEIMYRNSLANAITQKLRDFGVIPAHEDPSSTIELHRVETVLESIKFNFDESGEWSKENYESWVAPFSSIEYTKMAELFAYELLTSTRKVDDELSRRRRPALYREAEFDERLIRYSENHKILNTRKEKKCVTPWPCFVIPTKRDFLSYNFSDISIQLNGNTLMGIVWRKAINSAIHGGDYQFEENISVTVEKLLTSSVISDYTKRSKYKRVHIELSEDRERELSQQGINGKKFKDDPDKIRSDNKSKHGFDLTCDVKDDVIGKFLDNHSLLESNNCQVNYLMDYDILIERALKISESDAGCLLETSGRLVEMFKKSDFFSYAMLITEMAIELLLSVRQNCKKNEYVLKTLKFRDLLMLIKPTNSQEHIFVSLLMSVDKIKNSYPDPFNKIIRDGDHAYTNFFSFDSKKLSQYALCGPMMINMFVFWCQFFKIDLINSCPSMTDLPTELKKMMNLSLLIFLEQKTSTEEILTQFRYLSMEAMKDYPGFCDTLKVLEKMPSYFRSRLSVWVFSKLMKEAKSLYGLGYQYTKSEKGELTWINFRNPYTETLISDPSQLINLYYLGYLRDKNIKSHFNQDSGLISKILKGEYAYWGSRSEGKLGSQQMSKLLKYDPHAYDVTTMRCIANHLKQRYQEKTRSNVKESVYREFQHSMVRLPLDAFTTLKASSAFLPGDDDLLLGDTSKINKSIKEIKKRIEKKEFEGDVVRWDQNAVLGDYQDTLRTLEDRLKCYYVDRPRPRVVEAFADTLVNTEFLFDYLPEALDVSLKNGLYVDLFKKAQMGGIREIYVLNREARFIQYTIEQLSRILCSAFESETMTHPKNKINLMTSHGFKIRSICKSLAEEGKKNDDIRVVNSNSSKDKKSWNNTNSPSKFAILLLNLTPKVMHPYIFNTLKCWDNKKILLPKGIRNLIMKGNLKPTNDKNLNRFYESFNMLKDPTGVTEPGKPWMRIKTGMMQGILHFTSSLAHAGFNEIISEYFTTICRKQGKQVRMSLFTHLESSDDTSYLKTLWVNKDQMDWALKFLYQFDLAAAEFGKYAGFHESYEKSTHHSTQTIEFNSEFCVNNQINKPDIKFVIAALRIPECESVSEVYYQYKNLLTSCLEGGSTILACHHIQKSQALMHYLTFGLTSNPIFPRFVKSTVRITDPGVGFFLLDPYTLSGIVDQQFNVWLAILRNPLLSMRVKLLLESEKLSSYSSGMMTRAAVLPMGDRKRWRRIMTSIEKKIGPYDETILDTNPQILFDKPRTKEEKIASMYLKLRCPTVVSSLGNTGRLDRVIVKGAYILQYPCITLGSVWEDVVDEYKKKLSLYNLSRDLEKLTMERVEKLMSVTEDDFTARYLRLALQDIESEYVSGLNYYDELQYRENPVILSNMEMQTLFPHCNDYASLLKTHNQARVSTVFIWETNEKKKAKISILRSPGNVQMGLENVCKTLWFGKHYHFISNRIFLMQVENYKMKFSWLKDSFKESFESSKFENVISFANFVKEQAGKNRTINVCSAPLKISRGESTLRALINRHMWPKVLLTRAIAEDKIVDDSNEIFHVAASLAALPLFDEARIKCFKDLCKTRGELSFGNRVEKLLNKDQCSRREERMKPIIAYARGSLPHVIESTLLRCKMGVVGSWTKSERYVDQTYTGEGVWQGTLDDSSIMVRTRNSQAQEISVTNPQSFRESYRIFVEWAKENHVVLKRDYDLTGKEKQESVGYIQDGRWHDVSPPGLCVPIRMMHKANTPTINDIKNFDLDFTKRSIRLRAKVKRFSAQGANTEDLYVTTTLVSVRLYDSDIQKNPCSYSVMDNLLSKLLSNLTILDPDYLRRQDTTYVRRTGGRVIKKTQITVDSIDPIKGCSYLEFETLLAGLKEKSIQSISDFMKSKLRYQTQIEQPIVNLKDLLNNMMGKAFESTFARTEESFSLLVKDFVRQLKRTSHDLPFSFEGSGYLTWFNVLNDWDNISMERKWDIFSQGIGKPVLIIEVGHNDYSCKLHTYLNPLEQAHFRLNEMKVYIKDKDYYKFIPCHPPVSRSIQVLTRDHSTTDPETLPSDVDLDSVLSKTKRIQKRLTERQRVEVFDIEQLHKTLSEWLIHDLCEEGLISRGSSNNLGGLGEAGEDDADENQPVRRDEEHENEGMLFPHNDVGNEAFFAMLDEIDMSDAGSTCGDNEEMNIGNEMLQEVLRRDQQETERLFLTEEEIVNVGQLINEEPEWKPLRMYRGNLFKPLAKAMRKFCSDQFTTSQHMSMKYDCDKNLHALLNFLCNWELNIEPPAAAPVAPNWQRVEQLAEVESDEEE